MATTTTTTTTITTSKPHAVLISSPGMGHLIAVLQLGHRLSAIHPPLSVTVLVVDLDLRPNPNHDHRHDHHDHDDHNPLLSQFLSTTPCHVIRLPPIEPRHLITPGDVADPSSAAIVTLIAAGMRAAKPLLRAAISELKLKLEVEVNLLVVDLFGSESLDLAGELGIPYKYVYIPTTAWFLSLTLYLPTLDGLVSGEYVDQPGPIDIPGCRPVRPAEFVDPMLDRSNRQYHEYVRMGVQIPKWDGILVNTWEELEPKALRALRDEKLLGRFVGCPVHPVGPLTRPRSTASGPVLEWLNEQPRGSVIFVSFGSGGTLSFEQTTEIALGLEMSGQRFVWVVRPPTETTVDSAYLKKTNDDKNDDDEENDKSFYYLPDGFLGRTRGLGLVVPFWAQQAEILGHGSVGGFLTHCGWNSAMEGVMSGVPMLTWPLYAEQRMNAAVLVEELGVAATVGAPAAAAAVVGREVVERAVRRVMVGDEGVGMRERVREVRESGERALERGGSSYNALSRVLSKCCGLEN